MSNYIWKIVLGMVWNLEFVKNYVVMNSINNLEAILSCSHGWGLRGCNQI